MTQTPPTPTPRRPEVLAPAGSPDALKAALACGADAVYFGLDEGFNARARATNFSLSNLASIVRSIHRAGARAYLTMNTLVFEPELDHVETILRRVTESGVDAIIVQDPAVALIAREICPELEIHASTQMTIADADAATFARGLGATRVVVPRELSVAEIARFAAGAQIELEVFVHGALCVSWSGQCLTSEAWGGRSANRGECAQSCRMPYSLDLDGDVRELGDVKYILSPKDLAGTRAVPELVRLGVHGLKIEGRQKGPHYVATAVRGYRRWVDAVARGEGDSTAAQAALASDLRDMTLAYSRGFGDGFLGGSDHQTLVEGRFPKHRGIYLGRVRRLIGSMVHVGRDAEGRPWTGALAADEARSNPRGVPASALSGCGGSSVASSGPAAAEAKPVPGMGVVFDDDHPEDKHEPGGPIFGVETVPDGWLLRFGDPGPDLARVRPGQRVWLTSDPAVTRSVNTVLGSESLPGRIPVVLTVFGAAGEPLRVAARSRGQVVEHASNSRLAVARSGGLDQTILEDKLGSFGGTPFALEALDASALGPGLHLPVSELKVLRRTIAAELEELVLAPRPHACSAAGAVSRVREAGQARARRTVEHEPVAAAPELLVLCRTDEQLGAVIEAGLPQVELDWMEMVGLARAVGRAKEAGLQVTIATLRVVKPGEEAFDRRLADLAPHALLVRHLGGLVRFARMRAEGAAFALHGDFSLNVTNGITADHLLGLGLDSLTASHDLDRAQLDALLLRTTPERMTVVVHHRIATFHTEHCVYAHLLSEGRDHQTCGRPCEVHRIGLRDHLQRVHPVIVDAGCRNTVFNSEVQSAASLVPGLIRRGVRRFRIELVRESKAETLGIISAWQAFLGGRCEVEELLTRSGAVDRVGVAHGSMTLIV